MSEPSDPCLQPIIIRVSGVRVPPPALREALLTRAFLCPETPWQPPRGPMGNGLGNTLAAQGRPQQRAGRGSADGNRCGRAQECGYFLNWTGPDRRSKDPMSTGPEPCPIVCSVPSPI